MFDTLATMPHVAADAEADALCRRMQQCWVEFARSGRPAADDVPAWAPYTLDDRATMRIDRSWTLERDPLARERAAWNDVPTGPTTRPWSRVVA